MSDSEEEESSKDEGDSNPDNNSNVPIFNGAFMTSHPDAVRLLNHPLLRTLSSRLDSNILDDSEAENDSDDE